MEKIFLITSGGNEPRPASSVSCEQNTCGGSHTEINLAVVDLLHKKCLIPSFFFLLSEAFFLVVFYLGSNRFAPRVFLSAL